MNDENETLILCGQEIDPQFAEREIIMNAYLSNLKGVILKLNGDAFKIFISNEDIERFLKHFKKKER